MVLRIIHPLRNVSKGVEGCLDLLCYCFIHMENYSTEHYERGRGVSEMVNFRYVAGDLSNILHRELGILSNREALNLDYKLKAKDSNMKSMI